MATRYWVGGTGTWNTTTNWSASSGGAGGASVPISTDDVVFDANSGLVGNLVSTCDVAFTINNLTITTSGTIGNSVLAITVSLTVNGTMSCSGTAGNRRFWIRGATYGLAQNLTVATASNLADLDFRDIYVKGAAAPISGTRIGNLRGCSGITFSTPKTVYWNLAGAQNWSANGWAATSTGTPSTDYFPLAQDTATFTDAGSVTGTITLPGAIPYTGTVDMSGRTSAMTLSGAGTFTVYGDWKNGSGTTLTGNTQNTVFSGRNIQTIISAGKTFFGTQNIDSYGGTVQLGDAFVQFTTLTFSVTNGTFNTNNYSITFAGITSSNSNVRAVNLGSSTVNCTSTTPMVLTTATNLTFNAGTSQINITSTAASTFAGGGQTFYNVAYTGTTAVTYTITGANTFNNFSIAPPSAAGIMQATFSANTTINGTLTCAGASAIQRIFVYSDTIGTQRTLTAAAISANDCDFRDIVLAGSAAGASPTRAGNCGNNSGITFPSPKTVYWNLAGPATQNWSATGWATSSGGSPAVNNFPLAQDTAVFDNTGSADTVSINAAWNIGTFDASLRTSALLLSFSFGPTVYGDWKFGTGISAGGAVVCTFSKNGTQTITSNGVQFSQSVTINNPYAYVQLADALLLGSTRTLTLQTGTFDAVTYNVTTGLFINSSASNTVKMGSGTWTLSGTGTVWNTATSAKIIAGTSTIVLSDTSTTARTFTGGNLYYNKLTIGGTTGISTTTLSGSNTFGELASTKTVAHTILFTSVATTNIGKWSVTGTAGNVVTVGPTTAASAYTLSINGPANTGIDYLSISYCTVASNSPGEFYVGANSTNTAGNTGSIIFTATPSPRTLYWVGGTGNWSSTTKWSTASGGVSGAAIPTSLDSVNFDSLSNATAYTATIDAGVTIARCAAFTMAGPASGNVTFAGLNPIAYHGNVSFAATGITRTYTGSIYLAGNSSYTFTTNGLALSSNTTINGIGSTWTLGSALNIGALIFTVTYGTFSTSTSNYALTAAALFSTNTFARSVSLNGSTVALSTASSNAVDFTTKTNLTFNAGTSQINLSGSPSGISSGGLTFYNVSFTNTGSTAGYVTGANTFNNLTFTGQTTVGINAVTFSANQTINGTLTLGAGTAAAYRTFLASDIIGTTRTLTVNALAAGASDIDFMDIAVTGAAAPLTGTRFGDCKGNSGITFPAAKTVYYRQTGSASWGLPGSGSWSATSGGAFDATMFPLAQDTAVFPAATYPASGSTTALNAAYNIGTIDMSLRTSNTMTLATSLTTPSIYGNWINGTGITLSGTGIMTFAGRGSQTITSAGVTFTQPVTVNSPSGSVILQDAFVNSYAGVTITLTAGTFNANNYNLTFSSASSLFSSSNSNTRTVAIGSGTWTIAGAWTTTTSTNLTVTGSGTISLNGGLSKTFDGGGISYSGITLNQGGAGQLTIASNNTFANITNTYGSTGATTINLAATTQTVGAFTAAGTAGKLLTIKGTSAGSSATIVYSGGGTISNTDYLSVSYVKAYSPTTTWYAGANSTNLGSLGWIFSAAPGPISAILGNFLLFF